MLCNSSCDICTDFNRHELVRKVSHPKRSKPQTFFWKILKRVISEMIWKHDENSYVRCSQQIQVARYGNNDPYLMFRLHPYGLFEDIGKNMTLFVKVIIPDDCPPIHPSTMFHLTVRIYAVEEKEWKQLHVHQLNPKVNSCVLYLHNFVSLKELQKLDWKELNIEISTSTGKGARMMNIGWVSLASRGTNYRRRGWQDISVWRPSSASTKTCFLLFHEVCATRS